MKSQRKKKFRPKDTEQQRQLGTKNTLLFWVFPSCLRKTSQLSDKWHHISGKSKTEEKI